MQNIREIRGALSEIPEAIYPFDPQTSERGDHPVSTVWKGEGGEQRASEMALYQDDMSAEEESGEWPQAEELFEFPPEIDDGDYDQAVSGQRGKDLFQSVLVHGIEGFAWYVP